MILDRLFRETGQRRRKVPPYDYYAPREQRPLSEILDDVGSLNDPRADVFAAQILVENILKAAL